MTRPPLTVSIAPPWTSVIAEPFNVSMTPSMVTPAGFMVILLPPHFSSICRSASREIVIPALVF